MKLCKRSIIKNIGVSRNKKCLALNGSLCIHNKCECVLLILIIWLSFDFYLYRCQIIRWKILNTFYTTETNFYNVVVRRRDNVNLNSNAPPPYTIPPSTLTKAYIIIFGRLSLGINTLSPFTKLSIHVSLSLPLSLSVCLSVVPYSSLQPLFCHDFASVKWQL